MHITAIESLEPRRLMAQTVDQLLTQILSDVNQSKATVAASAKISAADQHTIAVDLRPVSKANDKLLKTLGKDFNAALTEIRSMQKRATTIGVGDMQATIDSLNAYIAHKFSAKTLKGVNKALAKLSKDDNTFVSSPIFNAFYNLTAVPENDEILIGTANPGNSALTTALPALEAEADFSTPMYPEFNALVMDVSTFATYVLNTFPGTIF